MSRPSHLDTIGPDHHAEMEAHYAAGMERQEAQFLAENQELLKAAIWAALSPFQNELLVTGGVTFMGLRNAVAAAVEPFIEQHRSDAVGWHVEYKQARREKNEAVSEIVLLRERLEDKTTSMRVELAAKQGAHNEIRILEDALRRAVRRLNEGHEIRPESQAHYDMQDALPDPA